MEAQEIITLEVVVGVLMLLLVLQVDEDAMYAGLPVYAEPVWGSGWWDTPQARMYIPANPVDEWVLFGIGVVVLVASTLFVYFKLPQVLVRARIILE